jgi:hypothetical protein
MHFIRLKCTCGAVSLTDGLKFATPMPPNPHSKFSKRWLDEVAAGTEKGIHDTPAWKAAIKRLGLKEARRRLRIGCLVSQLPDRNPMN